MEIRGPEGLISLLSEQSLPRRIPLQMYHQRRYFFIQEEGGKPFFNFALLFFLGLGPV